MSMLCQYALNSKNELVYIDDVPNGEACNCRCIKCNGKMIARNGGAERAHHFSHFSCPDCGSYRETILHIWSKQIIKEHKQFSLPKYQSVVNGHLLIKPYEEIEFEVKEQILLFSTVEIEERADLDELQPDIVGVTNEGLRLWIEIYVTHKCSEKKISIIKKNGINCIEVKIPKHIETKEQLERLLLNSMNPEYKYYINFPYGEDIILKNKKEYNSALLQKCKKIKYEECNKCYKDILIQGQYTHLLNEFKGKLPDDFSYIFEFDSLKKLIAKHPYIRYLGTAVYHNRISNFKNNINKLTEQEYQITKEFSRRLSQIIISYGYDVIQSFHWNCKHIFAVANKENNYCVFCSRKE